MTLSGPFGPVHDQGGGSIKPSAHFIPQPPRTDPISRPSIPKSVSSGPVYSEKILPLQPIKSEILHHSGHLGLLLAAGKLDGIVGEGPDRHVVKGKVKKVVSKVEEYKGDVLELRELDRYVVSIKILNRNGEIRELT